MARRGGDMRPFLTKRVWIPRFNLETNVRFIELYRKHRMLWDPDHPLYGKHAPRFEAYKSIAKAMKYPGFDAASVRSKIKIMRSCYISSRKQIASKAGSSTPHKPVDWFWTADAFLHDKIRIAELDGTENSRRHKDVYEAQEKDTSDAEVYFGSDLPVSSTVEVSQSGSHHEEEDEEDEEEVVADDDEEIVPPVNVKTEVVDDNPQYPDNSIYLELDDEQLMAIENGEMSVEDVTARAEAAASQHQQEIMAARTSRESRTEEEDASRAADDSDEAEDEFDAFGRCVALQLKTLPIDTALELESQIHSLITKKRMLLLRKNNKH